MQTIEKVKTANSGGEKGLFSFYVRKTKILRKYAKSVLIAAVLAIFIKTFLIQHFTIPTDSMENTMLIGDSFLVNKFIFGIKLPFTEKRILKIRNPQRGDVIVFKDPGDSRKDFVNRVIGIPGDVIQIKNKNIFINGNLLLDPFEIHKESEVIPQTQNPRDNTGLIRVPGNSYFVMGDNRDQSYDSRFFGGVSVDKIEGLAFVKLWSWDKKNRKVRWNRLGRWIE